LLGGAVLCATALSVQAADLPRRVAAPPPAPAPVYVPPPFSWTGLYIGGQVGGDFGRTHWSDPFGATRERSSLDGFSAGGQIGYNYQFGALVAGVEGDFTWTNLQGNKTSVAGTNLDTRLDWTSTVTGRLGYAIDRALIYGKGGAAFAQEKDKLTDPFGATATSDITRAGWTAGAGVEYGITNNWSAKVEYDFLGFGSQNATFGAPPVGTTGVDLNVQQVKGGVNYHF
jgi:outer membrane immunogenic protein